MRRARIQRREDGRSGLRCRRASASLTLRAAPPVFPLETFRSDSCVWFRDLKSDETRSTGSWRKSWGKGQGRRVLLPFGVIFIFRQIFLQRKPYKTVVDVQNRCSVSNAVTRGRGRISDADRTGLGEGGRARRRARARVVRRCSNVLQIKARARCVGALGVDAGERALLLALLLLLLLLLAGEPPHIAGAKGPRPLPRLPSPRARLPARPRAACHELPPVPRHDPDSDRGDGVYHGAEHERHHAPRSPMCRAT